MLITKPSLVNRDLKRLQMQILSKFIATKLHTLTSRALAHINGSTRGTSYATMLPLTSLTSGGCKQVHILGLTVGYIN